MKTCFNCEAVKPLIEFYKCSTMLDGHLNKCKECIKAGVRANRESKKDYYLEYDRNRPNAKERNEQCSTKGKEKYHTDPKYRQKVLNTKQKWSENNLKKRRAQQAATNAVRDGKLERKYSCEHCGTTEKKLQKHHWSYLEEHWLDVVWLCPACHGKEHKRLNALGRDPDKQTTPTQG